MMSQFLTVKRVAPAVPVPHSEENGSCCQNISVKTVVPAVPVPYSKESGFFCPGPSQ